MEKEEGRKEDGGRGSRGGMEEEEEEGSKEDGRRGRWRKEKGGIERRGVRGWRLRKMKDGKRMDEAEGGEKRIEEEELGRKMMGERRIKDDEGRRRRMRERGKRKTKKEGKRMEEEE